MVSNEVLFGDNFVNRTNFNGYGDLKEKIESAFQCVQTVVPVSIMKHHLAQISSKSDISETIVKYLTPSTPMNQETSPAFIELMLKSAVKATIVELNARTGAKSVICEQRDTKKLVLHKSCEMRIRKERFDSSTKVFTIGIQCIWEIPARFLFLPAN